MDATIETIIKPGTSCGASEIRIVSGAYAYSGASVKLNVTLDEARTLAATLTAAIAAHAVACKLVPAQAAIDAVAADAVADANLPGNAAVVS